MRHPTWSALEAIPGVRETRRNGTTMAIVVADHAEPLETIDKVYERLVDTVEPKKLTVTNDNEVALMCSIDNDETE